MNIIYLHGFNSSSLSIKGLSLKQYCSELGINVHLPDLNRSPDLVVKQVSELIESLQDVALVGSSLGGFFATYFVAKYNVPAVLINPAMQPWKLFDELFQVESMPYVVNDQWSIDHIQLRQLQQLELKQPENADKILVLLQQGDEILDYRQAQRYYSAATPSSLILTDAHGNHAMEDFEEKLPLVIEFFAHTIK